MLPPRDYIRRAVVAKRLLSPPRYSTSALMCPLTNVSLAWKLEG